MKRVALILLFILLIFIFPQYIVLPLIFIVGVLLPYIFYEIVFFGILLDVVFVANIPLYTLTSIIVLVSLLVVRKRMSFHV